MNDFLRMLEDAGGRPPIGTFVMSASPIVAEAVGCVGFDWVVLDMEHSPIDIMGLVHLLHAVGCTASLPIVRVPWNDPVIVKRTLDAGANVLLFPFIESAEDAKEAVASTRYPPNGVRGMAGVSRFSRFGTTPQHFKTADSRVGVIVQLETVAAIGQLEQIAAVPGVDAIFVGPSDLSGSVGCPGDVASPRVQALVKDAVQRCKAVGRPVGTIGGSIESVESYRQTGFDFIGILSDMAMLMRHSETVLKALRKADERPAEDDALRSPPSY